MSEPKNEYEPWKSHGQTEVEYFRARHIEQSAEIGRLKCELARYAESSGMMLLAAKEEIERLLRRLVRFELAARQTVAWYHRGTTAGQPFFVTRLEEALAYDGEVKA